MARHQGHGHEHEGGDQERRAGESEAARLYRDRPAIGSFMATAKPSGFHS
jgi:hypothetical protein